MREDASVSQSQNALLSDLQHKGNPSLNRNMSGNSETTKGNNMTQGRASAKLKELYRSQLYSDSLSFENPTINALARMPEPPDNGVICEEVREISISMQNRRRLEMEADSMDEMSHFNEQPSEILNYSPKRKAVDSPRKETSSGAIEGIEVGYNPTPESASEKQSYSSPYLDSLLHFSRTHSSSINAGHESPGVVDSQTNNQKTRNKSSSPWSAAGSVSKEDLVQRYGMRLEEAAKSLKVSVSTFKRLCRVHGLSRWPSAKKMREDASVSQSQNALLSDLQHKMLIYHFTRTCQEMVKPLTI